MSRQLAPRLYPLLGLLALLLLAFVGQMLGGCDALQPTSESLIAVGGNLAPLTLTGDVWRLVSSMFLHAGVLHLALNAYMLWIMGNLAIAWLGRGQFLLLYAVAGVFGSLASAGWHAALALEGEPLTVSVGASGAIMGLVGACFMLRALRGGNRYRRKFTPWADGRLGPEAHSAPAMPVVSLKPLAEVLVINVVLGFLIPGIDQACHLGGLAAGGLLGAVFARPWPQISPRWLWWRAGLVSLAAVGLLALGLAVLADPRLSAMRQQFEWQFGH